MTEFELMAIDQLMNVDDSLAADDFVVGVVAEFIKNGSNITDTELVEFINETATAILYFESGNITSVEIESNSKHSNAELELLRKIISIAESYVDSCKIAITLDTFEIELYAEGNEKRVSNELSKLGFVRGFNEQGDGIYFAKEI